MPESFGNLTNLQKLVMSSNELASLPDSFGNLSSLRNCVLSYNQLTSLPEDIDQLSNLEYLAIGSNQLSRLPKSMGKLIRLEYLDFSFNQLTSLPDGLKNFNSLQRLFINDNLLPTDYDKRLNTLGIDITFDFEIQNQLKVKNGLNPFSIKKRSDLTNVDLLNSVEVDDGRDASSAHKFIF